VEIELPPFWIGKYEVTWSEYRIFIDLCGIFEKFEDLEIRQVTEDNQVDAISAPSKLYDSSFTFSSGEDPRQPAVSMSQYAAKQYTKWLSLLTQQFFRLPSEAEWEYACRAGSTTAYCFGDSEDQLGDYAWFYENSDDKTQPVGLKKPNAWGIHDMHGNASEWVLDAFDPEWYEQLAQQDVPVTAGNAVDWPTKLFPRVLRGGSWYLDPVDCRSAARRPSDDDQLRTLDPNVPKSPWWFASDDSQDIGMRIIRPLNPPADEERGRYWDADVEKIRRAVKACIVQDGRGRWGLVDPELPQAIEALDE
jgi:formylglycine-generating enzyme required for sulfatase activity